MLCAQNRMLYRTFSGHNSGSHRLTNVRMNIPMDSYKVVSIFPIRRHRLFLYKLHPKDLQKKQKFIPKLRVALIV